jgi:hypothetical protein
MEIRYRNEPKDLRLAVRTFSWFDRLQQRFVDLWLCMVIGMIPGAVWLIHAERWSALALGTGIAGVLVLILAILIRRSTRNNTEGLQEQTLRLEPGWLEAQTETSWSRRGWELVSQVTVVSGGVVIGGDSWGWHVIPARAFATEEDAQQFAELATQYWEAARQNPPAGIELVPPAWFQLPPPLFRLTYQLTEADLLKVLLGGGEQQKSSEPSKPAPKQLGCGTVWILTVIAMAVVLFLSQSARWTYSRQLFWTGILYVLSCVVFWVPGMLLIQRLRGRLAIRKASLPAEELTLTISGCLLRSIGRTSFLHWKDVLAVLQNESVINFKLIGNHFQVIPKRSFNSTQEADQFYQQCQEYWTAAQADPATPIAVPAVVIETGNPYQSPRQT